MGDLFVAIPFIKELAGAAGGGVVMISIYQFWLFMTVRENKKYREVHEEQLEEMKTTQAVMISTQEGMDKKLDKLIDLHLNGKKGK